MLTSTYIHAPGVGSSTERSLWRQGAATWQDFLGDPDGYRLSARQRDALKETLEYSVDRLSSREVSYFAHAIPQREHWRAAGSFHRLGYLDIETDGGIEGEAITVVGLYDGREMRTYLRGENLVEFPSDCREFDGFVTFFGSGFDLPMLTRRFPALLHVFADRLHLDLCPLMKRLGHKGGLKAVERQIGIERPVETDGLNGWDAVRLWRDSERGGAAGDHARERLIAYNRDDVVNMACLLDYALPRLRSLLSPP